MLYQTCRMQKTLAQKRKYRIYSPLFCSVHERIYECKVDVFHALVPYVHGRMAQRRTEKWRPQAQRKYAKKQYLIRTVPTLITTYSPCTPLQYNTHCCHHSPFAKNYNK
ncbi:hypothetical protein SD20_02775 [Treponema pallidum subsp. pallidum]|nr:hypothetical protein SD22_02780 [Treponema pallidum subsp. pallidum]ANI51197.1 hypothetical protein SD20_02775 [Treponema pallidum subsp. pallidum]AOF57427.1 hypothetical protein A9D11_02805 [Treponema pallidum subsp. pallidum]AOF66921.1 hypothetical protein A8P34_02810 [Treponema pallidum subsp. pallidum]AOF75667.1 hypothetical protein A8P43_02805 [Treponema pallidum subsp. pallidum]